MLGAAVGVAVEKEGAAVGRLDGRAVEGATVGAGEGWALGTDVALSKSPYCARM